MCYYHGHKLKEVNNSVLGVELKFLLCLRFITFSKMLVTLWSRCFQQIGFLKHIDVGTGAQGTRTPFRAAER